MKTPISVLLDCQYVSRWSMVGTDKESNVASHSFNVAMIAVAIYSRIPPEFQAHSYAEVSWYALIHDVREAYTGDIPTPTKEKMRKAGFDPDMIDPASEEDELPAPQFLRTVTKVADLVENAAFISEHGIGARGREAAADLRRRLAYYLGGVSPWLARAVESVMRDINQRTDNAVVEGKEAKENRKESPGVLYPF